jgi:glycosyltransferase involved in cell wall biosynthesis
LFAKATARALPIDEPSRSHCLVVVPTYNEALNIERLVSEILGQAAQYDVLVVDDGSPDGTGELVAAMAELRARIRALLRRAERDKTPRTQALTIGDLRIDTSMRRAWLAGHELHLTPKEFELLAYLMRNRGLVLPRDQLLRDVWGGRVPARSQTLDVHIRWLRQKVEPDPNQPVYIQTVRMIGYRFEGP